MTWPFRPVPNVNPPPEPGYWTVLDVEALFGSPDSQLKLQTDVPVRAAMLFSVNPPSPERRMVKTRGVWKQTGTVWHVAGGQWYWQDEHGDTYEHTWTITGWPPGLPLWYCFAAEQQGVPTVSRSILLNTVRPNPGALPQVQHDPTSRLSTATAPALAPPREPVPSVL